MKNRIAALAGVFIMLSTAACAQFDYGPDALYKAAQTYIRANDYKNALRSVHLAREGYEDSGNSGGVGRCDAMIKEINTTIPPKQMADFYYDIASDYYIAATTAHCDVVNLGRTIDMSDRAKAIYGGVGGNAGRDGVLKSEDLMKSAGAEKVKCEREKYTEAENLYHMAQSQFFLEDYIIARNYALNASEIYSRIPDPAGVAKSAQLLSDIERKVRDIKVNAAASYDKALRVYAERKLDEALEYAAASQRLYESIQDEDGYRQATNLVSRINEEIIKSGDELMRTAQKHISDAEMYFTMGDYFNATESAKKAKSVYTQFLTKAQEEEKDLPPSRQVKTNYYAGLIKEVNGLIHNIQEGWSTIRMAETAALYYRKAQEHYLANRLNEALAYANNARTIYTDLKDYVGISKTDTLLDQIDNRMKLRTQAQLFYTNAVGFYNVADFDNAYVDANKAKKIYEEMLDQNKTDECRGLLDGIQKGNEQKEKAHGYYQKAESYYDVLDYEKALEWSQKANEIYTAINYSIGMQESQTIMTETEKILNEEWVKFRNIAIGVGLVVVVVVVIVVQHFQKQSAMDKELREKRAAEEDRRRRFDEESAITVEKQTKERVEDELRKLIEQERQMRDSGDKR